MIETHVFVRFSVAGFHCWPNAPDRLSFLRNSHLHNFHVEVELQVQESREVEFFEFERTCRDLFHDMASMGPVGKMNFGGRSCEDLATYTLERLRFRNYDVTSTTVSEDGQNGAKVRWTDD